MNILKKITEIIKTTAMTEKKSEDIKAIFDSIRNIGICVALTLALPELIKFNKSRLGLPEFIVESFTLFLMCLISILYIYNIRWLAFKTEDKTAGKVKSKISFYFCTILFIIIITLLSAGLTTLEVIEKVF